MRPRESVAGASSSSGLGVERVAREAGGDRDERGQQDGTATSEKMVHE